MYRTNNLKVKALTPIVSPSDLKQVFPLTDRGAELVTQFRKQIVDILKHRDPRLMVVVGPCSIHDPRAALEYAERLARLHRELAGELFLVMRVYFEKPRTTIGWKGLINDPDLNGTHQISKGLGVARGLLCAITELGLPIAGEMLDPITPHYLADSVSWGAIGARTTESQTHREMASGLSFPVGFKNGTDGNLQIAIDAIGAALHPHSFLGINNEGRSSIVQTLGNPDVHIVLRGGNDKPNYFPEDIARTEQLLAKAGLEQAIMVDCSHANSYKNHERQEEVLNNVIAQVAQGNRTICALMIESNLCAGNQPIAKSLAELKYGQSITDKCVDWETTERMLRHAAAELKKCGGRRLQD
ncbi:3-deoxy-7-phosphoheptulonate synthase [Geoalkalibacter halelectricus]|uniref:Phospho-2-dehydro-3-deoxyheptonate aldolase n=1 Tax=Geoalkalibacter halelectricus TaxID=2847045 RepID=A0ABY5ZI86_9BACT|nr:3-deoxy-7-phosphoheptulonate synthase [Geoalkalibacter halelectricus]MDO3379040.1 3-deoxy-7-phosphoheptulonate synthase [Geoalkalibacter halelectricus]UWZ78853.1 3-deoxy-7-phosphoheptulonate synthase [Geoalkalibacter halelectricus]